jgi:hypothetical protein
VDAASARVLAVPAAAPPTTTEPLVADRARPPPSRGSDGVKLKVTNIEAMRGDATGGTYVHIYGSRFLADADGNDAPTTAKIYFGAQQGRIVRFPSDSEVILIAPGGIVGETVDILVMSEGRGEITIPRAFSVHDANDEQDTERVERKK